VKKKLSLLFFLWFFWGFTQHQMNLDVKINTEEKLVYIQQEIIYFNQANDTLHSIILNDWNNAFSSKTSALAKRFSDEFNRSFHLAPDSDRGYTDIKAIADERFNEVKWIRPEKHVDIVEILLNKPLAPFEKQTLRLTYIVKIPNERFTQFGFDTNGKMYLKNWYLAPALFINKKFIVNSNENLDDISNAIADYQIHLTIPKNYKIASDLTIDNSHNDVGKYVLSGKNYQDIALLVSPNQPTNIYKNEIVEVDCGIENSRLDDYQKAIVIDKITRFVEEKLGHSAVDKILVSNEDYKRQPFYGLNQLPAFLSPYPDEFMFELMFLKTYLNNYLKANIKSNPRKYNWIYDGIQIYTMMEYIDTFHPDMKMTGNLSKIKLLKSYNFINLPFNEQYNYLYMLTARKNLDQPVGSSKEKLIKFNEQISNKYRSGLNFKYLDSYLQNDVVSNSIQEFLDINKQTETTAYDFEYILKKNSPKNIDWFFDTLVNSRDLIDYTFGSVKKSKERDSIKVTIKNRTRTNVPISFYELKNDTVVYQKWFENIKTDTTIVIPNHDADKLTLNYNNEIPEYNLRNNWKSMKGFFFNNRPFKFTFFRDLEDPYYNQILYVPEFEYNLYDGMALGLNISNKSILNKPFTFSAAPFYSPNTQSVVGKFSAVYDNNIREEGKLYKVRYLLRGSQFHYAPNARYTNFSPSVQFFLRDKNFRTNKNEYILLKQLYINRESSPVITDINTDNYSVFNAKYGNYQAEGTKLYSLMTDLQVANSFGKLSAVLHYRKLFEDNRQITLRFFAGTFLYRSTKSDYFSFGLDRPTDYMFEENLLGRSETTGLYSQQFVYAEGGFKSMFETRYANQWMVTTNAAFNIWNWIQVYGDVGAFKNEYHQPKFVYDSGIHLNIVPDYFELFFPVYSSNGFELNDPNYNQKIRFVVTLAPKTLISLFTRKWF
jgi:hypothetical protein